MLHLATSPPLLHHPYSALCFRAPLGGGATHHGSRPPSRIALRLRRAPLPARVPRSRCTAASSQIHVARCRSSPPWSHAPLGSSHTCRCTSRRRAALSHSVLCLALPLLLRSSTLPALLPAAAPQFRAAVLPPLCSTLTSSPISPTQLSAAAPPLLRASS